MKNAKKITAESATWTDYTCKFKQMYNTSDRPDAIPMFSYDRPAYLFWSAFMNGLMAGGMTEQQAIDWLCSKETRWALDGELGEKIEALAFDYALLRTKVRA